GAIFRHDRDQHVVLWADAGGPREIVGRACGGESAIFVHGEIVAEVYARSGDVARGRAHRARRIRRVAPRGETRRGARAVPFFVPSFAGECRWVDGAHAEVRGLSAGGGVAARFVERRGSLCVAAGAWGGVLQHRSANHWAID